MKKFDFYTVQFCVDGFGNDTYVESIWKTEAQAQKRAEEIKKECREVTVIGGIFGKALYLAFN